MTTVVGVLAAIAGVTAFAPQAWRVIRTRKTAELATAMWVLNVVAFGLWATYGFALGKWAIVVPNLLCWIFSVFILMMKLVSPPTRHAIADVLDPAVDAGANRRGEAAASSPAPDHERR
jgi:MtN3 and saliva related transmembrane protein